MIADMIRVVVGLTAWVAGTVIAVSVASFGANVVLRNAGTGPGVPVINGVPPIVATTAPALPLALPTAPLTPTPAKPAPAASAPPATHPASSSPSPSQSRTASPTASPAATASATAGSLRDYTLAGGRVTLDLTPDSVQLVTAIPDAGYSVQTWSGTGWLRVDFSSGPQVSSLIASWYEHAPSVTVTN
jgi:hypothetical protein